MLQDADEPFDPVPVLARFARAGIDFVVIGGVAGAAHGSAFGTYDIDIAYSRERSNLQRIVEVLDSIEATLRGAPAGLPFQLDVPTLEAGGNFTFSTSLGSVDLRAYPEGGPPYEQLKQAAMVVEVAGHPIRFASLDHLIGMKDATGRPRDRERAQELRLLSDELRAPRES